MRRLANIAAIMVSVISLAGCEKEYVPSYVGTWLYVSSEPALDPAYNESYVVVKSNWDYSYFDSSTNETFSGDYNDYKYEGTTITLTSRGENETRVYVVVLKRLKEGRMVVETSSVNGTLTTIEFSRKPGSF
ncbi:MAG: hypothetical protein IJS02_03190 [Bacteroidales bacterium]|nr:hypothetical protein [Bacteroidales bacterium]